MDAANKGREDEAKRSGRSIFELGEIRRSGWSDRPMPRGGSTERGMDSEPAPMTSPGPRLKNVGLSDRQLSLAIGAVEHVLIDLRKLPGTEATIKEYEACLIALRQALAVLPPAGSL